MAEKPIPFSGPMVRAILEGRKTQTRRVLSLDIPEDADVVRTWYAPIEHRGSPQWADSGVWAVQHLDEQAPPEQCGGYNRFIGKTPFEPGDHLYVREAWRTIQMCDHVKPRDLPPNISITFEASETGNRGKLRPGIFLPKWASRIWLEVTDVRVERVQDISDADSIAEGVEFEASPIAGRDVCIDGEYWPGGPRRMFSQLWDSPNAKRGFGWDANPWVVVYTFKRIKKPDFVKTSP